MDYDIIKQVIQGNIDKFDILITKYYNEIFKFVYNQINHLENTKDVVQEIFMRIFDNLGKYNPEKSEFRTWIYRISANYCINYQRNLSKNFTVTLDETLINTSNDILKDLIANDDVTYVMSLMEQHLSKRNFKIMILHFFSDLDQKEIGSAVGLAHKTIRNIVSGSIAKIRDLIGGKYNDGI